MKEFIIKHPFVTTGIIFGVCKTFIKITSNFKRKTNIFVIAEGVYNSKTFIFEKCDQDESVKEEIKTEEQKNQEV